MEKALWDKIESIVDEALTLSAEDRDTFVAEQCKGNEALTAHVTQLLNEIKEAEDSLFLEEKSEEFRKIVASGTARQSEYEKGDKVGPYEIEGIIASGGMGSVYKAERADGAFEMDVAIKFVKTQNYSGETLRRFELERRILAKLKHPNIARMLDGGITADGVPYIILEFVNGTPIDEYCRKHNCSIKERIALFEQVLKAVRYAHENLVIHRDLKPGNILVDETGKVKILDFGISKLLGDENDVTLTQTGTRLLTPRYAAPEQIRQENITTATDLYALGTVFYELLAGTTPFDLEQASRYEMEQATITQEPSKPSHKVEHISQKKKLKGDLDAIALKAIRKEPEQRYRVANEFLEDLNDYQNGLPVSAREGSLKYRTQKFLGRHKFSVAAATIVVISLISGFSIALWQAHIAGLERDQARKEKNKAEEVTEFLTSLFEANHPDMVQGKMPTARDLLDVGVERINISLNDDPFLRAEMQVLLGRLYFIINEHEEALPLLEESLALAKKNNDVDTQTEALHGLSLLYERADNLEGTFAMLQQANQLLKSAGRAPGLRHAILINEIRGMLMRMNKNEEARKLTRLALASARSAPQLSTEAMFYYLKAHGTQLRRDRKFEESKLIFKEALDLNFSSEQAAEKRFEARVSLLHIAYYSGDQEEALSLHKVLLKEVDEIFPEIHGARIHLFDIITRSYTRFGLMDEAEQSMRQSLEMQKEVYPGENRFHLAWGHAGLGFVLRDKKQYSKAYQHFESAREIFKNLYGKDYHAYILMTADMGDIFRRQGRYEKSEELLSELPNNSVIYSKLNPVSYSVVQLFLAKLRLAQKRPKEALEFLDKALDGRHEIWNKDKRLFQETLEVRARVLAKLGEVKEAEVAYSRAIALGDQISLVRGIAWPQLLTSYALFLAVNKDPGAREAVDRALEANQKLYGDPHSFTQRAKDLLVAIDTH